MPAQFQGEISIQETMALKVPSLLLKIITKAGDTVWTEAELDPDIRAPPEEFQIQGAAQVSG